MIDEFDDLRLEEGFATLPEWLLRAQVSSHAKVLYAVLQRYGNTTGVRMPSLKEVASWMHCSEATVSRANAELERYGAVRVTRMTRQRTGSTAGQFVTRNRYFLVTSDPTVAHVRPVADASCTDAKRLAPVKTPSCTGAGLPKGTTKEPPPTPSTPRSARPEEEVPLDVLTAIDSVDALCNDLRTVRRAAGLATARWTNRLVRRALRKAFDAGFDPSLMAAALRIIASDRATGTPGRLAHDGPWWATAEGGNRPAARPAPIGCQHCDCGFVVDADGLPTGQKCVHCHPAHRHAQETA